MTNASFVFYLGEVYMGECDRSLDPIRGGHNLAFFCPMCGGVWARAVATQRNLSFFALHAKCPSCGLGSLRHTFDGGSLPALPSELLKRELILAADHPDEYWALTT